MGRRRALLVGIDRNSLKQAPWRDVALQRRFLLHAYNFREDEIAVIKDDDADNPPTQQTVMEALQNLTHDCGAEDTLLFYFSGLNTAGPGVPSLSINHLDSISGEKLQILAKYVAKVCKLNVILDVSRAGAYFDKLKFTSEEVGQLVAYAACRDHRKTKLLSIQCGAEELHYSAFTFFFCAVLSMNDKITNQGMLNEIDKFFTQHYRAKTKKAKNEAEMDLKNSKKKKMEAVLVGLKNPHPQEMNAGIDMKGKILRMKKHLIEVAGFLEDNITVMIEDEDDQLLQPTDFYISRTLYSLVDSAERGDILFIHLIAYGCSEGSILTADKKHIPDCFFRGLIASAVEKGCNLTFVSDCLIEPAAESSCTKIPIAEIDWEEESVKGLTMFVELFANNPAAAFATLHTVQDKVLTPTKLSYVDILNPNEKKKTKHDGSSRVILLTPFRRDQNAATQYQEDNVPELFFPPPKGTKHTSYGGLTKAILDVIEEAHGGQVTNLELAQKTTEKLGEIPNLCCSHHNHAYASFVC